MSERGDMVKRLYEACLSGSVPKLNALIQEDQLILNRVNSLTDFFNDTPLHVVASCGHLDVAKVLLSRKPKLATELDSLRRSPLHLASTEGHVEIVQELLRVNTDVCCARDQEGRTPLHLAAIKERVEVIRELLRAKPESICEKLDKGETILHLCVKYNRLEALKTLIEDLRDNDKFLLSCRDDNGNTTLHLATALKQMNTIKYLLEIKSVKDCANVKNRGGFTALDVIEHCPNRDLKSMEIREFLLQAGVQISNLNLESPPEDCAPPPPPPPRHFHCVRNVLNMMGQCIAWFWTKYFAVDSSWLKEVRGHLITAATLTATMAYQAILSPPGGLWQEDKVGSKTGEAASPVGFSLGDDNIGDHKAGQAILDSKLYGNSAYTFIGLNNVVLFASLCTIMLALSGFPNTNKLLVWLMIFTVYITLSCMAVAYDVALTTLFPNQVGYSEVFGGAIYAWVGAIGFVLVLHTCHFLVWLVKKLIQTARCLVCLVKKITKLVGRCFCRRKIGRLGPNNHIPQNPATTSNCCIGNYC